MPGSPVSDLPDVDPALLAQFAQLRQRIEPPDLDLSFRHDLRATLFAAAERAAIDKAQGIAAPSTRPDPRMRRLSRRLLSAGVITALAGGGLVTATAVTRSGGHHHAAPAAPGQAQAAAAPTTGRSGLSSDLLQKAASRLATAQARLEQAQREHAPESVLRSRLTAVADALDAVSRQVRLLPTARPGLSVVSGPAVVELSRLAARVQASLALVPDTLRSLLGSEMDRVVAGVGQLSRDTGLTVSGGASAVRAAPSPETAVPPGAVPPAAAGQHGPSGAAGFASAAPGLRTPAVPPVPPVPSGLPVPPAPSVPPVPPAPPVPATPSTATPPAVPSPTATPPSTTTTEPSTATTEPTPPTTVPSTTTTVPLVPSTKTRLTVL